MLQIYIDKMRGFNGKSNEIMHNRTIYAQYGDPKV